MDQHQQDATETRSLDDDRSSLDGERPQTEPPLTVLIARAMVTVYKENFGRGPTRARAFWCDEDTIVCILEQSLIPAEKSLQRLGEHKQLRDTRTLFQYAARSSFVEPIEQLTGRSVRSFISGMDTDADVAVETFVLQPKE